MNTLYGIKNCTTVKRTRTWLDENHIPYQFHDYRGDGLDQALLEHFLCNINWQDLLNRRSTSWRQLSEAQKTDLDKAKALQLMLKMPTLIKRPLLDTGKRMLLGFKTAEYQSLL